MVLHNVGDGLGICGGAGSAAPDGVVNLGELVCYSIRDVCAGGCSAVCSEDDTVFKVDGHAVRTLDNASDSVARGEG